MPAELKTVMPTAVVLKSNAKINTHMLFFFPDSATMQQVILVLYDINYVLLQILTYILIYFQLLYLC